MPVTFDHKIYRDVIWIDKYTGTPEGIHPILRDPFKPNVCFYDLGKLIRVFNFVDCGVKWNHIGVGIDANKFFDNVKWTGELRDGERCWIVEPSKNNPVIITSIRLHRFLDTEYLKDRDVWDVLYKDLIKEKKP